MSITKLLFTIVNPVLYKTMYATRAHTEVKQFIAYTVIMRI